MGKLGIVTPPPLSIMERADIFNFKFATAKLFCERVITIT
jgi:hypothetical protein